MKIYPIISFLAYIKINTLTPKTLKKALWRSAAIGQSGFTVGIVKGPGGIIVPPRMAPYVQGFLPPYKGAMATVCGMTYARAAIFYLSDYGHDVMIQQYQLDEVTSTVLPPLVVSTIVQVINQP